MFYFKEFKSMCPCPALSQNHVWSCDGPCFLVDISPKIAKEKKIGSK